MSVYANFRGRARPQRYVPPRPAFTVEQRLDACLDIADRIERGVNMPLDDLRLVVHLKALREAAGGGES